MTYHGRHQYLAKVELCPTASSSNYGSGWPGTLGVPALTSSAAPVLCSLITMSVDNSSGTTTPAAIVVGLSAASLPNAFGGILLVLPTAVVPFTLPGTGANLPYSVLCGDQFCGLAVYLQVLEVDPGASQGVSFTAGLALIHGR